MDIFVYNLVALKILNPNFKVLEKNMAGVEVKPLKKVNKHYKIRRKGSSVGGFKYWKERFLFYYFLVFLRFLVLIQSWRFGN